LEIADIFLEDVLSRATAIGITVEVTERFKEKLVNDGYNPLYGARPLRRAISRLVEDSITESLLTGVIKFSDSVILDVSVDGTVLVLNEKHATLCLSPTLLRVFH
jgi:ATP-dependent Clp protease ATP-binding subunit ClpC